MDNIWENFDLTEEEKQSVGNTIKNQREQKLKQMNDVAPATKILNQPAPAAAPKTAAPAAPKAFGKLNPQINKVRRLKQSSIDKKNEDLSDEDFEELQSHTYNLSEAHPKQRAVLDFISNRFGIENGKITPNHKFRVPGVKMPIPVSDILNDENLADSFIKENKIKVKDSYGEVPNKSEENDILTPEEREQYVSEDPFRKGYDESKSADARRAYEWKRAKQLMGLSEDEFVDRIPEEEGDYYDLTKIRNVQNLEDDDLEYLLNNSPSLFRAIVDESSFEMSNKEDPNEAYSENIDNAVRFLREKLTKGGRGLTDFIKLYKNRMAQAIAAEEFEDKYADRYKK